VWCYIWQVDHMRIYSLTIVLSLIGACTAQQKQKSTSSDASHVLVKKENMDTAIIAGGCFWCMDAVYRQMEGIVDVESGYNNGRIKTPTYREVCTGLTGCVESVQITYDTSKTSYQEILEVFWRVHNPTTLNRQGNDVGTQYRSGIYYLNDAQKTIAEVSKKAAEEAQLWDGIIVTEILPLEDYSKAEDYHQNYYENNPNQSYCQFVVGEKVEKFKKLFKDKLKKEAQ